MTRIGIDLVAMTLATIELDFRSGTKMVGTRDRRREKSGYTLTIYMY